MRSAAHIKGHPIHPSLIPFPFAFLYGAFFFDLVGRIGGWSTTWTTGAYLALVGIIMALVAAVPGFVDYFRTVPPRSSAKARATKHMALNLTVVVLFAIAWGLRGSIGAEPGVGQLVLEGIAIVALTFSGWMGGTLVDRNQIGVDHRYAGAGRWREETVHPRDGGPVRVARADELRANQMKLVHVGQHRIVVARSDDGYIAFEDRCTHAGGSLADGVLICDTVQCPWHGSQFDVRTGRVKAGPAEHAIKTYRTEERRGEIYLLLTHHDTSASRETA